MIKKNLVLILKFEKKKLIDVVAYFDDLVVDISTSPPSFSTRRGLTTAPSPSPEPGGGGGRDVGAAFTSPSSESFEGSGGAS